MTNRFIEYLRTVRDEELLGMEAHDKMMPKTSGYNFRSFTPKPSSKSSAVLILFTPGIGKSGLDVLLTLRNSKMKSHSGQISFPGGMIEKGETQTEAALREAWEETGINISDIDIITSISDLYVLPSDSLITPIVGYKPYKDQFKINPAEVEEAFNLPFDFLIDRNNKKTEHWHFNNMDVDVPLWDIQKKTPLWGATAMIMSEIIELYRNYISK